ncbi:MAG: hypothetical protein H6512_07100 [Acidimicrobiia bacterium]|nr:hypothetical protein [Acidimicrobiia bacterium]
MTNDSSNGNGEGLSADADSTSGTNRSASTTESTRRSRRNKGRAPDQSTSSEADGQGRDWKSLAKRTAIFLAIGAVITLFFATVMPRWWSHQMGSIINGSMWSGWMVGLAVGALFTALPLLVLLSIHRSDSWKTASLKLLGAVVLALPNLLTLGIVIGNGSAAHAGERTLDVEAPGFRVASLIGALIGAGLVAFFKYLIYSRKKLKNEAAERKAHNDALIAAHEANGGDDSSPDASSAH